MKNKPTYTRDAAKTIGEEEQSLDTKSGGFVEKNTDKVKELVEAAYSLICGVTIESGRLMLAKKALNSALEEIEPKYKRTYGNPIILTGDIKCSVCYDGQKMIGRVCNHEENLQGAYWFDKCPVCDRPLRTPEETNV